MSRAAPTVQQSNSEGRQAMRKSFSPAMIVALVALFVALSGTAVAASGLVTGEQIKNHSIGVIDLSTSAVKQLRGHDGESGIMGQPGPIGATGPAGPAGAAGKNGLNGSNGASGSNGANGGFDPNKVIYVKGPDTTVPADSKAYTLSAVCPAGTKAIAGGGAPLLSIQGGSVPFSDGTGWALVVLNDTGVPMTGSFAFAICAAP
jgi:collagen triple helix repeat protein